MEQKKIRVIAYYLPQYHPIPENDEWWGKGFTEWINVARAKPLFKGHYQPKVPADLGFYDLRLPEIREEQAKLARKAGIEGFCYWHYWFGNGKQLLEHPFNEVLESGKPDFPFCLGWANHSWTNKSWEAGTRKVKESVLVEQTYSGKSEYTQHFYSVFKAFKDSRYITVDGKPLFVVFDPLAIPNVNEFIELWQSLARENGLQGIHFVGSQHSFEQSDKKIKNIFTKNKSVSPASKYNKLFASGYDAVASTGHMRAEYLTRNLWAHFIRYVNIGLLKRGTPTRCKMSSVLKYLFTEEDRWDNVYPTLFPNWDRTPRSGSKANVFEDSTPDVFKKQVVKAISLIENKSEEHRILFLRSWNEWGEGNYMEPDQRFGHGYIDALSEALAGVNGK